MQNCKNGVKTTLRVVLFQHFRNVIKIEPKTASFTTCILIRIKNRISKREKKHSCNRHDNNCREMCPEVHNQFHLSKRNEDSKS